MSDLSSAKPIAFVLTKDRAKAKPFYSKTLGLRLLWEDDFAAVYDLAGTKLRLTSIEDHQPQLHPVLGWELGDIVATVRELGARGVKFITYPGMGQDNLGIWHAPGDVVKVAFFADLDGNVLSLTQSQTQATG